MNRTAGRSESSARRLAANAGAKSSMAAPTSAHEHARFINLSHVNARECSWKSNLIGRLTPPLNVFFAPRTERKVSQSLPQVRRTHPGKSGNSEASSRVAYRGKHFAAVPVRWWCAGLRCFRLVWLIFLLSSLFVAVATRIMVHLRPVAAFVLLALSAESCHGFLLPPGVLGT